MFRNHCAVLARASPRRTGMCADARQDNFRGSLPLPTRNHNYLMPYDFPDIPSAITNTDTMGTDPDDWESLGSLSFTDSIDNLKVDTQMS